MFAQTIHANISLAEQTELRQLCLITDGNAHRPDLLRTADMSSGHADVVSEALLPEIRSTAMLIAASRHDWNMPTPDVFADEADWFAARILLLNVRFVHLHTSLAPMLQLANSRAQAFAERNRLPFTAAKIRPSLHNKRPAHVLLMACDLPAAQQTHWIARSSALRQLLVKSV